jgi:hypothetical protein
VCSGAARKLPTPYKGGIMSDKDDDILVVAGFCFLGAIAVLLVGVCVIAAYVLLNWLMS